jgi:hypothetical protein
MYVPVCRLSISMAELILRASSRHEPCSIENASTHVVFGISLSVLGTLHFWPSTKRTRPFSMDRRHRSYRAGRE